MQSTYVLQSALNNDVDSVKSSNDLCVDCFMFATTVEMVDALGPRAVDKSFPFACKIGCVSLVAHMLDKGADPTSDNFSGLLFASEQGHDQIVKLILKHLVPSEFKPQIKEAHSRAVKYNRDECVHLLAPHIK